MLKIVKIPNTFENVLDIVFKGISEPSLLSRVQLYKFYLIKEFENYEESTTKGDGFKISTYNFSKKNNIDPFVVGSLKHSELSSLYSSYFVPKRFDSRVIYNRILASSVEGCPYCGGIGSVKELDHFLPKSKYPQFSLLTSNLIPSCKICNQDLKKSKFAKVYEEQIIHPYNDFNIFFEDKWIDVKFKQNHGNQVEFFVSPPDYWSEADKQRAKFHFEMFDLAERYSTFIAGEYLNIKQSIDNLKFAHDNKSIVDFILQHVIDGYTNPNNCRKVLYEALKRELLQVKLVGNVNANLDKCPRCRGNCKILGTTCDLCKGMGTAQEGMFSDEDIFKPVDCPKCDLISLDLDCDICNGEGAISLDKARNIENWAT